MLSSAVADIARHHQTMLKRYPANTPGDAMARLTIKSVETAGPSRDRREIPDGYVKGLYLIVQPSGAKSWAVRYRTADGRASIHWAPIRSTASRMRGSGVSPRCAQHRRAAIQRRRWDSRRTASSPL